MNQFERNKRAWERVSAERDKQAAMIAALQAELESWREMERMIVSLHRRGWHVNLPGYCLEDPLPRPGEEAGVVELEPVVGGSGEPNYIYCENTLPEAVKAAYDQVVGVDE